MLSSLILAALAAAWLVVLVPIFARRRQEVSRTTDSALAGRVVRRGSSRPVVSGAPRTERAEEAFRMPGTDRDEAVESDFDDEYEDDDQWRAVYSDDARAGRRYRPGRGGFDPEAAALVARTKYARRQRIGLIMLLAVVTTALLAALLWTALWWLHVLVDLLLVGYLTYLRRQVRIEEEVRSRRLARMAGRDDLQEDEVDEFDELDEDQPEYEYDELDEFEDLEGDSRLPGRFADAVVVDIDDEDPMFDELDERTWEPYRRAVGE